MELSNNPTLNLEDAFLPYEWTVKDGTPQDGLELRAWCLDRNSKPVLVRIVNYVAFCYAELPTRINRRPINWSTLELRKIRKQFANWQKNAPIGIGLEQKGKLYYYRGDRKFPFVRLEFSSIEDMKICTNLMKRKEIKVEGLGMVKFNPWDQNIPIVRKFLTIKRGKFAQWFNSKKNLKIVEDGRRVSTLKQEYIMNWTDYSPIDPELTIEWAVHPLILSFDLETYSENHKCFPVCSYAPDVIFAISVVTQRYKLPETMRVITLIAADCYTDEIEGEVIICKDEIELIRKMEDLILEFDPDILMGYNIFGFDNPYLDTRLKLQGLEWKSISRIRNKPAYLDVREWSSGAYGTMSINIIACEGRINIDLLPIMKRDHPGLPKHSLEVVSQHFLKRGKVDMNVQYMFEAYKTFLDVRDIYSKEESEQFFGNRSDLHYNYNLLEYFRDKEIRNSCNMMAHSLMNEDFVRTVLKSSTYIQKHPALDLVWEKSPIVEKDGGKIVDKRCIACLVRLQDLLRLGIEADKLRQTLIVTIRYYKALEMVTRVGVYCAVDSIRPLELFDETQGFTNLVSMSNVLGITIVETFTRGQQVRAVSQLYDMTFMNGVVMDSRPAEDHKMEGGYVKDPVTGLHENVFCIDFNSLYPSIIIAYNICFTTFIPNGPLGASIPDSMCNIAEWDQILDNGKVIHHRYRFIKAEYKQGLIPTLVKRLVTERGKYKKLLKGMKGKENTLLYILYNSIQAALKVSANSTFGFLSTKTGRYPLIQAGMSITFWGRFLIKEAEDYCHLKHGLPIIYGDTDSTMPKAMTEDGLEAWRIGDMIADEVSKLFPEAIVMENEKVMRMASFKKKKYAYLPVCRKTGKVIEKIEAINSKGILTARKDNSQWQRDFYMQVLFAMLCNKSLEYCFDITLEFIIKICRREVPYSDLIIIRKMGSGYKNSSYLMKVFGDELSKIGKPAQAGEKLDYLVVKSWGEDKILQNKGKILLGKKMRLPEVYLDNLESDKPEPPDSRYYIRNLMRKHINQLFEVIFKKELEENEKKYEGVSKKRNKLYTYLNKKPIDMILNILKCRDLVLNSIRKRRTDKELRDGEQEEDNLDFNQDDEDLFETDHLDEDERSDEEDIGDTDIGFSAI